MSAQWLDGGWFKSGHAALRETLHVDADTRKAMIEFLYEAGLWDKERLSWPAAEARWNGCLNPAKPEYFKLAEVWALMREFGRHQLFLAMADDLGYERPMLIPTETRRMEILQRLAAAEEKHAEVMAGIRADLEGIAPSAKHGIVESRASTVCKFSVNGF